MTTQQIDACEQRLADALRTYDWRTADGAVAGFAQTIREDPHGLPDVRVRRILQNLRKKRRFQAMRLLTSALPASVREQPQICRLLAQSLIEQGKFAAAEDVLLELVERLPPDHPEHAEAQGLLGRTYKQRYVSENADGGPYRSTRSYLQRAVDEYRRPYLADPAKHYWHGINVVACLDRARRDGISVDAAPNAGETARRILAALLEREANAEDALPAYEQATILECMVAIIVMRLAGWEDALVKLPSRAIAYAQHNGADAFELGSTLRQLTEVWQLTERESPGAELLPVLRAALLHRGGDSVELSAPEAQAALGNSPALQRKFGGGFMGIDGWKRALQRTTGVARVEEWGGLGVGTGWIVNAADFFSEGTGPLFVTNSHVVNESGRGGALRPSTAKARFHEAGEEVVFESTAVWSSPVDELDVTFLRMKNPPSSAVPLPVTAAPVCIAIPPQFLYIIGHPGGGHLAFSLHDNVFLARNDRFLHYRTPTESGSSGSPVFDPDKWEVVALHRAGASRLDKLDGSGTYEANQGVCTAAIRERIGST